MKPARRAGNRRIGVFGGTFDPVHNAHIAVAEFALKAAPLDHVLFVPTGLPWLRGISPGASAEHRVRMTELAIEGHDGLTVSRVDVDRPGETYTADTLHDLRREYGQDAEFVLILGADSARSLPRWKRAQELPRLSTLLIIGRPGEAWPPPDMTDDHPAHGAKYLEGPMVDVSATEIRRRLVSGEPVGGMMPAAVENYIRQHGLYGVNAGKRRGQMVQTTETRAERLLERAKELGALRFGDFTLSSGQKSTYYFDGRLLGLDPEGSDLISSLFLEEIGRAGCQAFGGPAVGAVPIVGALTLRCWQEKAPLTGFFVRSEAKKHGMGRQVEGSVKPGMKVAVFDDTISTGGGVFMAIDAIQEFGCEVALVLCVLDRKQGGSDEVKRRGLPFVSFWEATPQGDVRVVRR